MNMRLSHLKVGRFMLLLVAILCTLTINAIPAKPGQTRKIMLADGNTVTARLVGDEFGHFWVDTEGKAYREDNNGIFHQINRLSAEERAKNRRIHTNEKRGLRLAPGKSPSKASNFIGKKKGIIILVNFNDVAFEEAHDNSIYNRIANEKNFKEGYFKGSVNDYFYAQSEGQFDLEFDVVGPVTVSEKRSYYGTNNSAGDDKRPATMIIEACHLVDSLVNFADYDWDGDKEVDQVFVVFAGKGEADGGPSSSIWPHEWKLSDAKFYNDGSGAQTIDGVTIDTYACGAELNGSGSLDGIGTICHEFSHCLGYPDFYDIDYSDGQGMGYWDLMDSGCYNGEGYLPSGYTSYERWVAGWMEPVELTGKMKVTEMLPLQEKAEAYIIYNNRNKNEYFLLENRGRTGWDAELPGTGLLILHVDYDEKAWENNTPNDDPKHQRMTWIPADNDYQYQIYQGTKYYTTFGMKNDPFPYGSVNSFGRNTTPAAKFYNKTNNGTYFMDFLVSDIKRNNNGLVSFYFNGIIVATPTISPKQGSFTGSQTITISCDTKEATIYYTTDESTPNLASKQYTEPFTIDTTTVVKAIAILDHEISDIATAYYTIRPGNPSTTDKFRLVKDVNEVETGKHYIIGSTIDTTQGTAAGEMGYNYLTSVAIDMEDDIISINDEVEIFTLEGADSIFSILNSSGEYLYATATKKLAYTQEPQMWKLSQVDNGVAMSYKDYGTLLYYYTSPCFNIYTSKPSNFMLHALLFKESDETAIHDAITAPRTTSQGTYSLSGMRMTEGNLPKGIYIRNGKKFVVK